MTLEPAINDKMLDIVSVLTHLGVNVYSSETGSINKNNDINIDKSKTFIDIEKDMRDAINFYPSVILNYEDNDEKNLLNLITLLDEFYSNKKIPTSKVLILEQYSDKIILKPQNGDVSALEQDKNKKAELYKEFHKEFNDFTAFLKTKVK